MRVKITADSTCDLPVDIIEKYNIGIAPLYIIMGEKKYKDGFEIGANDIFEYVDSGKGITGTDAINISEYTDYFSQWKKECDAIIHISLSTHFSACHQSAKIAAEGFENVFVVDSFNLSTGSGHIVLNAAIMAESGMEPEDIVRSLIELIPKVEASFVIGDLKLLHLGGKCSGLQVFGSNILKLNHCIDVKDGKMSVEKKFRGAFDKIASKYVEDRLSGRDDIDLSRVFITYPPTMSKEFVDMVAAKVRSLQNFEEVICCNAGCVVSNHCGSVCFGILFLRK